MTIDITKDARRIMLTLYKVYMDKRDSGMTRSDASYFGDSKSLQKEQFPLDPIDDISDFCWELKTKGYIFCSPGDDLANNITILPETIILMENRFPNGMKQVAEALKAVVGIVGSLI